LRKLRLEALDHRLQGPEAVADLDRVDLDAESLVVIVRREPPCPTVFDGLNACAAPDSCLLLISPLIAALDDS
jgi:hypothetical protein